MMPATTTRPPTTLAMTMASVWSSSSSSPVEPPLFLSASHTSTSASPLLNVGGVTGEEPGLEASVEKGWTLKSFRSNLVTFLPLGASMDCEEQTNVPLLSEVLYGESLKSKDIGIF